MSVSSEHPRILHVSTPRTWRGGEQQMAYLVEALHRMGVPQLIVCRKGSAVETVCRERGWDHAAFPKRLAVDPFFARALRQQARAFSPSLIHAHDAHAHSLALLAEAVNGRAIPLVVSRRVDFPIRKSRLSRNKYHHPRVHKIICVSKAIERITAAGLDNPGVLTTVHSGIDPERFPQGPVSGKLRQEFGIPSTTPLVGNVAALAPHKDYFTFLDTVRFLQQEGLDARYLIIGDGPQKEEIQRYARDHGLTDVVLFTGFRSDIPEVLPELDLFLITSETEGLGTSILDAFACRVPVVATRAGGIPELVEHESTGLLAPVKAPTELGAAVLRMLGDAALRERVVATASEKLQGFTKDAMAAKTLAVYQEVVRKLS